MSLNTPREFIGRYRIIKILGRGAMGQVYLAHDPKIDRLVAIKTIIQDANIPAAERDENHQRFLREAQAAGKLLHPVIVTIFDVAEEEGEMYIAMEYIEGESLEKYVLKENLLPYNKVLDFVRQAAEGLDYAHKFQVVHRDIKPANIMVIEGRAIKITDFGLAKNPSTSITQAGMLVGTPNYMSPEQIQGVELDGRSDLFSLGVVFYELLTGGRPFTGKSISTVIYKILHEHPPGLDTVLPPLPPGVAPLVAKALAKKPEDRFSSGAEFAAALRKVIASGSASIPRPAPSAMGSSVLDAGRSGGLPSPLSHSAATNIGPSVTPTPGLATGAAALPDLQHGSGERVMSAPGFQPRRPRWPLWLGGALLLAALGAGGWLLRGGGKAREPISLTLTSDPPGAKFAVDGITGEPYLLKDRGAELSTITATMSSGSNCLRGKRELSYPDARHLAGKILIQLSSFRPKVRVTSNPDGARIFLNGKDSNILTPNDVELENCGPQTLRIELTGYAPSQTVKTGGPEPAPIELSLSELAGSAPLAASAASTPALDAGAGQVKVTGGSWNVAVKGQKGNWSTGDWIKLPAGKYTLTLSMPRIFARREKEVEIKAGESSEVNESAPSTGTITILSRGSVTPKIFIDGQPAGEPPIANMTIATGTHVIKAVAKNDEGVSEAWDTETKQVTSGSNTKVTFVEPG
jgi:serine/threonine protein kinase